MTLDPTRFYFLYREYPMFLLHPYGKDILFNPKANPDDTDLTSKAYILMKRLGQSYDKILLMDSEERDLLFNLEMELIKKENVEQNGK